ncbi:MAG TPA: polyprenyl diphosphate synthase, partial [Synergistales bacterium]|nr:polyprenyl diphosphate synthase [Synergistales bacterium]
MQLLLCLNYGGRQEIIDAIERILSDTSSGKDMNISEDTFRDYLYLPDVPDPDLIIRTSGELRLSNFWLWQSSYSEFYFTDVLWPDFNEDEFDRALGSYNKRNRRYGSV